MHRIKISAIVGARPQFIKAAAVSRAIENFNREKRNTQLVESIIHTGQHYDENMSQVFFDQLKIPRPSVNLEVGSGPHGQQTGQMLEKIEAELLREKPDVVLIYGDTNTTLAGAVAAAKMHIPVAHVEAGLRSFNRRMPEEVNRIVADHLSSLLFCPTETSVKNLLNEGITEGVHQIGDVMYDSVLFNSKLAEKSSDIMARLKVEAGSYCLATIHRAENTDDEERFGNILTGFSKIDGIIILPMHPRTRKTLRNRPCSVDSNLHIIDPVSYLDMLILEKNARCILTDSGGVQKEAYWFGIPCITLRDETEWIELVEAGVNQVVGTDISRIVSAVEQAESFTRRKFEQTSGLYGNGHSTEQIVTILAASSTA
jgi:UDP-GlcNAc3NAcA epimerase